MFFSVQTIFELETFDWRLRWKLVPMIYMFVFVGTESPRNDVSNAFWEKYINIGRMDALIMSMELYSLIVLGDGGHRGTVNKDGCQEFISCGTYPPSLNNLNHIRHTHLPLDSRNQVGVSSVQASVRRQVQSVIGALPQYG